jgi:hypothetical protein
MNSAKNTILLLVLSFGLINNIFTKNNWSKKQSFQKQCENLETLLEEPVHRRTTFICINGTKC